MKEFVCFFIRSVCVLLKFSHSNLNSYYQLTNFNHVFSLFSLPIIAPLLFFLPSIFLWSFLVKHKKFRIPIISDSLFLSFTSTFSMTASSTEIPPTSSSTPESLPRTRESFPLDIENDESPSAGSADGESPPSNCSFLYETVNCLTPLEAFDPANASSKPRKEAKALVRILSARPSQTELETSLPRKEGYLLKRKRKSNSWRRTLLRFEPSSCTISFQSGPNSTAVRTPSSSRLCPLLY